MQNTLPHFHVLIVFVMLSRGPLLHALISVFELPEDDTVPDDEHFIEIEDTPGTLVSFYYANISIRTAWLV